MKISRIFVVSMVVLAAVFVYAGELRSDSGSTELTFEATAAEPMCAGCGCTKPKEGEKKEEKCCGKCGSEDGEKKECDKEKSGCDKEKSGCGKEARKSGSGCGGSKGGGCGAKK